MLAESEIKHKLTVKQVRDAKRILGNLLSLNDRMKIAKESEMDQITKEVMSKTAEQDEYLFSTLLDCLEITEDNLNNLGYLDAITKFNDLFIQSTQVEKKRELPSVLS